MVFQSILAPPPPPPPLLKHRVPTTPAITKLPKLSQGSTILVFSAYIKSTLATGLPLILQPCEVVLKMTSRQWLVILQVHIEHIPLQGHLPSTYPSCLSGASGVDLLRLLILILFLNCHFQALMPQSQSYDGD